MQRRLCAEDLTTVCQQDEDNKNISLTLRSMYPFEGDDVFDRTKVMLASAGCFVEVTFRQANCDASNVIGNVELELIAHGSVEGREEQSASCRVEDLVREVAIWVDFLDSVSYF